MSWQYTPVIGLYLIAGAICWAVALFAWKMRPAQGAALWSLTMVSCGLWATAAGIDMMGAVLQWKLIWVRVVYTGIAGTILFWTLFVLAFTQHDSRVSRSATVLLSIVPVCMLLTVFTIGHHSLFYRNLHLAQSHGLTILDKEYGPAFLIWAGYAYLAIVAGSFILIRAALLSPRLFRGQTFMLILGALFPAIANVLYVTGHNIVEPFDPSSLAFSITGIFVAYGIRTYRFLNIAPVALDLVFRNVNAGVLILDQRAQILDLNPAAERILSCHADQVIGKSLLNSFPEHRDLMIQFRDVMNVKTEIQVLGGIYELQLTPLTSRGKSAGRIILLYDITERKRAVEERERLIGELDAYASTVAHDLKSPLTTIIGYMDYMKEYGKGKKMEDMQKQIAAVSESSHKMVSIINELLFLSRIRGEKDVPKSTIDMASVILSAVARLSALIERSKAEVSVPSDWPCGLGHPPWVEEIWINYLSNAIKYGGSPPRVELGADSAQNGFHRYWVQDNGEGLSEQERDSLFVEFYRLERHESSEGHGLGLSIVKRIAEKMGGQAGAEPANPKGTRFYFTLPIS